MKCLVLLCLFFAYSRADEVCCPETTCFTDAYPFDNQPLPWCMDQIQAYYTMFTRTDPTIGELFDDTTIPSTFNPALRTVFEIHGWLGDGDDDWLHEMKDAFLEREDINVVIVGWDGGSQIGNYPQAAGNTRSTGAYTGEVIMNLVASPGASDTRIWCVGHSLGGHCCGHAGMYTQIQRATGLDPAGPGYEDVEDTTVGINPTSARYVDNVHTDYFYGSERPLGHIDFYPNGGDAQPSCTNASDIVSCSHSKAVPYMIESIVEDICLTYDECTDHMNLPESCTACTGECAVGPCAIMGYGADYGCMQTGIHYVDVDATEPYCLIDAKK